MCINLAPKFGGGGGGIVTDAYFRHKVHQELWSLSGHLSHFVSFLSLSTQVFDARHMLAPLATVMPYGPADLLAWKTYMLPNLGAAGHISKHRILTLRCVAATAFPTLNRGV
jgi:hypothetical protein